MDSAGPGISVQSTTIRRQEMTAKKSSDSRKVKKLKVKKETIKDLDAKTKAGSVKAGKRGDTLAATCAVSCFDLDCVGNTVVLGCRRY
jgi:stress response protein YsnF